MAEDHGQLVYEKLAKHYIGAGESMHLRPRTLGAAAVRERLLPKEDAPYLAALHAVNIGHTRTLRQYSPPLPEHLQMVQLLASTAAKIEGKMPVASLEQVVNLSKL